MKKFRLPAGSLLTGCLLFPFLLFTPVPSPAQSTPSPAPSISPSAQPIKGAGPYRITGRLTGVDTGMIYLSGFFQGGRRDSAIIKKGRFAFRGSVDEPKPFILSLISDFVNKSHLLLFIAKGHIRINIDSLDIGNAKVGGSASTEDYATYASSVKALDDQQNVLYRLRMQYMKDSTQKPLLDSVTKMYEANDSVTQEDRKEFITAHPSSAVSAWLTARYFMYDDLPGLEKLYAGLDADIVRTSYGKEIGDHITIEKRTEVGQTAPDFTQNDTLGRPVSLKDFRGKYVLLDFWASWCKPCRIENPNLVAAFKKYKDKNFTILSVSLDMDGKKQKWLDAINKDGLIWTHVSDLKFWDNAASKLYGILFVPSNFLIDPHGEILARNLTGDMLDTRLHELLK